VQCTNNDPCPVSDPYCDLGTYTCVGCLQDNQCTGGKRCNLASHQCTDVVCTNDNDCASEPGPKCKIDTGDCVQCLVTADCQGAGWCRSYECSSDCLTDPECAEIHNNDTKWRCEQASHDCIYAECLSDADCASNPENKKHCKTVATPSNPPQNSCVVCTDDSHCNTETQKCDKNSGKFVCAAKPCYQFADPNANCYAIAACYACDYSSGQCKPAHDCPTGTECCQGFTCNAYSHCEQNVSCNTDLDCPITFFCNAIKSCEFRSCCSPACTSGKVCNEDPTNCQCVASSTCKQAMDTCDENNPCCAGLRCGSFMFPFCMSG
jgi:hypothetical protein